MAWLAIKTITGDDLVVNTDNIVRFGPSPDKESLSFMVFVDGCYMTLKEPFDELVAEIKKMVA